MRGIKRGIRQAEHQLCQAEMVATPEEEECVKEAWRKVAFNHFHDILGGTSTPSSYKQQLGQVGAASAQADLIIQRSVRREMVKLPDESRQRIVLKNLSSEPFDGFVECEPWLRRNTGWKPGQSLMEKDGSSVPYQVIDTEMVNGGEGTRLLFRTCMAPMEMKVLLFDESTAPVTPGLPTVKHGVRSDLGFGVALDTDKKMFLGPELTLPLPRLILDDDPSDNWTHVIDRFPALNSEQPEWQEPVPMEHGPLMNACLQVGTAGRSEFRCEWRAYAHAPFVELHLRVHWAECRRLLRLELDLPDAAATRTDGIMDGWLDRPNQGRECPVRDWTLIPAESGGLGILCPDAYSLSVEGNRLALTLVRSPILTQHDTFPILEKRAVHSDQGEHGFRFRFCCGPMIAPEYLDREALTLHRPPLTADLTRGMPCN
jgi:alpha-mannosidase